MQLKKFISLAVLPVILLGCQKNFTTQTTEKAPEKTTSSAPIAVENPETLPVSRVATFVRPKPKPNEISTCMSARMSGRLKIKDSCLVLASGNEYVQPIFEKSSVNWDEATKTLTFQGKKYKEGDEMVVGGGGLPTDETYPQRMGMAIPDCKNAHLFLVCS